MKIVRTLILGLMVLVLTGCQFGGPSPEELAATMVAETAAAASPTPLPSATLTATLVPSNTPTITPTETLVPTDTPTATFTPLPTNTPTITPTPGPLVLFDDFSTQSTLWGDCPGCKWKDGMLYVGPYAPGTAPGDLHRVVCEACGMPRFYRIAVDVTFVEGYGLDRGFGLMISDSKDHFIDLEITTGQFCLIWDFDYSREFWDLLNPRVDQVWNGMVKPGYATNHLEVLVSPSESSTSLADYHINLNGKTSFILWNRPAPASEVGLVVGWHTIGVAFDNWEFEEIEP